MSGKAYIIGCGPGDEELLTIKAVKVLEKCTAVLYDRLVSNNILNYAKDIGCRKVLIRDLQRSMSLGNNDIKYNNMCIDENIFSKVIEYLKSIGFRENILYM